ncbi:MAG: nuclear transport factor 2 family protein [Anaerolineales bacterium]|jgi:ketosteroid isomerase-like protein
MNGKIIADETRAVEQAEHKLAGAHLSMDLDVMDRLLHPEYKIIQPDGTIENKEEVLTSYKSGKRRWDRAESDQLEVHVRGELSYVTGRWRASGINDGDPFDYAARFLSVWIREGGHWQNIAYISTEIPNNLNSQMKRPSTLR